MKTIRIALGLIAAVALTGCGPEKVTEEPGTNQAPPAEAGTPPDEAAPEAATPQVEGDALPHVTYYKISAG